MIHLRYISSLVFISLLLSASLFAQQNKFDIGVEGGPGISKFYGSDASHLQPIVAGSAGVAFQYNFPKIFSIRTGLDYERKGWEATVTFIDVYGNPVATTLDNFHFDYLTIPVLARATFGKKVRFFVNAGPYFSVLLRTAGILGGSTGIIPQEIVNATSTFKPFDFGISAGAGIEIPIIERFGITVEARNNVGLINVADKPIYNNGNIKSYATVFLVGFEYKFGMRGKS